MKKLSAALYSGIVLALAVQVQAQTSPAPSASAKPGQGEMIVIDGKRMPAAEAPRSATCEALVRNDRFVREQIRAAGGEPLMGPTFYLPTRMPRNPDYDAAPLSPPGSALPEIGRRRFGVSGTLNPGESSRSDIIAEMVPDNGSTSMYSESGEDADPDVRLAEGIAACRSAYSRGGSFSSPGGDLARDGSARANGIGRLNARFERGRATIVRNDKSLPIALALFDQRRFAESLDWFRKAHNKLRLNEGGDEAALYAGKLYLQGLGDQSDPAEGIKWLKKAASAAFNPVTDTPLFDPKKPELNTAIGEAAVILGNVYRSGFAGVPKNMDEARKWYGRALEVGHIAAAQTLGDIYFEGQGTPRDAKKAESLYRQAARYGLSTAQYSLAELLSAGDAGVKQDRKQALRWYQAAAKNQHPGALFALARAYDLGDGVRADQQMALGFYKSAALLGHSGAVAAMGTYFYEGKVLPKDPATARKWFEQAARRSDPDGTFNLAAMVARGEGGPRDLVQAWALMKRAAALGNESAPTALAALEGRMSAGDKAAAAALFRRN